MTGPGLIALITGGSVRCAMTAQCLERLLRPAGTRVEIIAGGCDITANRNAAVELLLATDGGWLLQVDDDELFSADTLMRLLERFKNPEVDVVSPLIVRRNPPHLTTLCDIRPTERGTYGVHERPVGHDEAGLIRVGAVGAGFLLSRRAVFERMPAPWFLCGRVRPDRLQEDVAFCSRVAGVFCDLDVTVGHVGTWAVWPRLRVVDGRVIRDVELQFVRGAVGELEDIERCAQLGRSVVGVEG